MANVQNPDFTQVHVDAVVEHVWIANERQSVSAFFVRFDTRERKIRKALGHTIEASDHCFGGASVTLGNIDEYLFELDQGGR